MQGKRERLEPTLKDAQDETEMVIFDAVENLLKTTNTAAQEACPSSPLVWWETAVNIWECICWPLIGCMRQPSCPIGLCFVHDELLHSRSSQRVTLAPA